MENKNEVENNIQKNENPIIEKAQFLVSFRADIPDFEILTWDDMRHAFEIAANGGIDKWWTENPYD